MDSLKLYYQSVKSIKFINSYFLIIGSLVSIITSYHFGTSFETLFALILCWTLLILSFIDYETYLLPDSLTLPCLWLGLGLSLFGFFANSQQAILGAILGYLSLWLVYWLFKLVTGKEGMGYGDFKLLAMLGAWLGWQALPIVLLLASLLGTCLGLCLVFLGRDKNIPLPFGPFLAFSGWIALLWGKDLTYWFLQVTMT
jgi:leader peptidase (prepilin peptidase)/N-methyltransferase